MPAPVSAIVTTTWSPAARVRTRMLPRWSVSPTASSIAWAALMTRLSSTWLISPASQVTDGNSPRSVSTSATALYSPLATTSVLRSASLRSVGAFALLGG